MKSPFHLLLSNRSSTSKNSDEGQVERGSNDRQSKVKFHPRGNFSGAISLRLPRSVNGGTTTASQSSLSTFGSGATPRTGDRHLRTSATKRYNNKANRDDDSSQSQNSLLVESDRGRRGPKMHHYHPRNSGANDHPTWGGAFNQIVRTTPSFKQIVDHKGRRNDELALACFAVGAVIDSCTNEESADMVSDALLAYACGYDDDDDDDDVEEEDVDGQKRDDSPTVYESFYQVVNGIGLSMEQIPRHHPAKVQSIDHTVQDSQEASQPSPPETVQPLKVIPEDVREDVDGATPDGNVHRKELQEEESGTDTDNSDGVDSSDDCSSSSIQTSQNGQELVNGRGENNVSSYTQSLLRALGYMACHEAAWSEEDDISFNPCQAAAATTTTSFKPANDADPSHQNDHLTQSSLPKLEQDIPDTQQVQAGKREKKSLFSRRFGRGIRTKRGRQGESKTLQTSNENSSEPPSWSQGIDLEPGKIETTSSVIVTTLEPTIVESASC